MKKIDFIHLLTILIIFGCGNENVVDSNEYNSTITNIELNNNWSVQSLAQANLDSVKISKAINYISSESLAVNQLTIYRNGFLVYTQNFDKSDIDTLYDLYSTTKSITSILIGILFDNSSLEKGIESTVGDIFPDIQFDNVNIVKKGITIRDLLTMQAGLSWTDENDLNLCSQENPVEYVLNQKLETTIGDDWHYNSGASHVLAEIIFKITGKTVLEYAKEVLFTPLGITNVIWEKTQSGCEHGGCGLRMSQKDLAKIGQLVLNRGKWNNNTIVSSEWIEESTKAQCSTGWGEDYGYQWWINNFGGFSSRGYMGQNMYINSELNMIVVFNSSIVDQDPFRMLNFITDYYIFNSAN